MPSQPSSAPESGRYPRPVPLIGDTTSARERREDPDGWAMGEAVTEALAQVVLDLSGRSYLVFDAELPRTTVGGFDAELLEEFLQAFVRAAGVNMHVRLLAGKNTHHMIEAIMKAFGRALRQACRKDERIQGVLSTKGTLE